MSGAETLPYVLSALAAVISSLAAVVATLIAFIYKRDQTKTERELGKLEEKIEATARSVHELELERVKAAEQHLSSTRALEEMQNDLREIGTKFDNDLRDIGVKVGEISENLWAVMAKTGTPRPIPATRPRVPSRPDK